MKNGKSTENAIMIMTLFNEKFSLKEISLKLNIPYSTVKKVIARYCKTKSFDRKKGYGRPKSLKSDEVGYIKSKIAENPKISISKIANKLHSTYSRDVTAQTIRNCPRNQNFISAVAALRPFLTVDHMRRRYQFANDLIMKSFKHIKSIIFSDFYKYFLKKYNFLIL